MKHSTAKGFGRSMWTNSSVIQELISWEWLTIIRHLLFARNYNKHLEGLPHLILIQICKIGTTRITTHTQPLKTLRSGQAEEPTPHPTTAWLHSLQAASRSTCHWGQLVRACSQSLIPLECPRWEITQSWANMFNEFTWLLNLHAHIHLNCFPTGQCKTGWPPWIDKRVTCHVTQQVRPSSSSQANEGKRLGRRNE